MSKPLLKTFVINIKNGKPTFTSDIQRKMFFGFLKQFEGKKCWMTLDTKVPKRSERQHRFYFLYLNIIANDTGNSVESLHNAFKQMFLHQNDITIYGRVIHNTKSTTELNKTEFADYLNEIEHLTEVPLPDSSIFELAPLK